MSSFYDMDFTESGIYNYSDENHCLKKFSDTKQTKFTLSCGIVNSMLPCAPLKKRYLGWFVFWETNKSGNRAELCPSYELLDDTVKSLSLIARDADLVWLDFPFGTCK